MASSSSISTQSLSVSHSQDNKPTRNIFFSCGRSILSCYGRCFAGLWGWVLLSVSLWLRSVDSLSHSAAVLLPSVLSWFPGPDFDWQILLWVQVPCGVLALARWFPGGLPLIAIRGFFLPWLELSRSGDDFVLLLRLILFVSSMSLIRNSSWIGRCFSSVGCLWGRNLLHPSPGGLALITSYLNITVYLNFLSAYIVEVDKLSI